MKIDRKSFGNQSEYEAALRDGDKIYKLKEKYNLNSKSDVDKLYSILLNKQVKFESSIGRDFDDEIYDLYIKFSSDVSLEKNDKTSKKSKKNQNANDDKNNIKGNNNLNSKEKISIDDFDDGMKKQINKELKKRYRRRRLLITSLSLIAIACIGYYIFYYFDGKRKDNEYKKIASLKENGKNQAGQKTTVKAKINNTEKEVSILSKYLDLYNSNKKLIGWIKIDDTNIDYPVMQCDDNVYYLNHNFDQEESKAGALFLDCNCDVVNGCDNYIIYGHHLSSGAMFSHLSDYQSESYYNKHKYIAFDTIYEEQTFQVMYVFRSRVYDDSDVVFKYYQFINANSEEEFYSYMSEMKEEAFYDTGVVANYGDQLLTLSTCDYNEKNGRFVVVAKRIY